MFQPCQCIDPQMFGHEPECTLATNERRTTNMPKRGAYRAADDMRAAAKRAGIHPDDPVFGGVRYVSPKGGWWLAARFYLGMIQEDAAATLDELTNAIRRDGINFRVSDYLPDE